MCSSDLEGYFYSYNIDLENGGECSLMKQYRYVGADGRALQLHSPAFHCSLLDSNDETAE